MEFLILFGIHDAEMQIKYIIIVNTIVYVKIKNDLKTIKVHKMERFSQLERQIKCNTLYFVAR